MEVRVFSAAPDEKAMKFKIGQVVRHQLFNYKGVIFGTHAMFRGSDTWYEQVALTRPPKDQPWYRVLVHGSAQTTYVAERNLAIEEDAKAIEHPLLPLLFNELEGMNILEPPAGKAT